MKMEEIMTETTKKMHTIDIKSEDFQAQFICLGDQIAELVEQVDRLLPNLMWYMADLEYNGGHSIDRFSRDPIPTAIGNADALIEFSQKVNQFLSGVFAGVPKHTDTPRFRDGGLWSEDYGEDAADLGDSVIEIRAFDTSWITVASHSEGIIESLRDYFQKRKAP